MLLPVNEPTFGTRRKSQIQTYLEQNEGPGLQHLALKTDDIFTTMRCAGCLAWLAGRLVACLLAWPGWLAGSLVVCLLAWPGWLAGW